jgi:hypothetical protein
LDYTGNHLTKPRISSVAIGKSFAFVNLDFGPNPRVMDSEDAGFLSVAGEYYPFGYSEGNLEGHGRFLWGEDTLLPLG